LVLGRLTFFQKIEKKIEIIRLKRIQRKLFSLKAFILRITEAKAWRDIWKINYLQNLRISSTRKSSVIGK